jgi:hypothetical protein
MTRKTVTMSKYSVVFVPFPKTGGYPNSAIALGKELNKQAVKGLVYESTTLVHESIGAFVTFSKPDKG